MIIDKRDDVDALTYFGQLNTTVEAIEFDKMTVDQYKCTLFVKGLVSLPDLDRRTKLLSLLETDTTITMEQLLDEYERISNLKSDATIPPQQQQGSVLVNKVSTKKEKKKSNGCECCGQNHKKGSYPAKDKTCEFCHHEGHTADFFFKRKKAIKECLETQSKKMNLNDNKNKADKKNSLQNFDQTNQQNESKIH